MEIPRLVQILDGLDRLNADTDHRAQGEPTILTRPFPRRQVSTEQLRDQERELIFVTASEKGGGVLLS